MGSTRKKNGEIFKFTENWNLQFKQLKENFNIGRNHHSWLKNSMWFFMLLLATMMWQCAKDDFDGETIGVCPEVNSTDPDNGAINVVTDKIITATFNEVMNPSTINETTFLLKNGLTLISGTVSFSDKVATFTPVSLLAANTVYTGIITKGAFDLAGISLLEDYTWSFNTGNLPVVVTDPVADVHLGTAGNFAILSGSGVTNIGVNTLITGDVGAFPIATINGLLPGNVNGILYITADPIVGEAKTDLTIAYNDAQARSSNAISLPGQLGGLTLVPGLYVNSTSSGISGTGTNGILTLDAGGNENAVWIFKMGSTLATDAETSIVLAGGAQSKNIYWSVGSSATFGTNSIFYGNILADQSITLTTGATLYGRALTRIGAVTLETNIVIKP